MEEGEDFFGCVPCEPHVDCEGFGEAGHAEFDLLEEGGFRVGGLRGWGCGGRCGCWGGVVGESMGGFASV